MKRTSIMRTVSESIAYDFLGESKPVLDEEDDQNRTVDPSTTVDYFTMPATVVVLRKGEGTQCVQEIPIGQIKQFRFVNYKELDSFWDPKKNIDKYKDFVSKYSKSKSDELNKWMKDAENKATVESAMKLQGYVGFDVIPNKSKLENPEPEEENPQEQKSGEQDRNAGKEQNASPQDQNAQKTVTEVEKPQMEASKAPEEDGPGKEDPETKGPVNKEVSKEMTRNMKTVAKGLQDPEVQEDFAEIFAEKAKESGKESQIDNEIAKILSDVLGDEEYKKFVEKGQKDVMKWFETLPKKTQSELLGRLQKLESVVPVGISDLRMKKVDPKFIEAARDIATEKGENVDETLWTGIVSLLSGLFGIAWGVLQLFFAHPLAMTGIGALFYIAYKAKRGRR